MVHQYKLNGYNIVLDTASGSVHTVDEVAYDIIALYPEKTPDEIVKIIDEELPDYETLYNTMAATGMPMRPSEIDVPMQDVIDAFVGARDIRDKYLSCSFLWDLGLTIEFASILENIAEAN